jgi:tRNA(Ile)-lysidine synthetase-like protein
VALSFTAARKLPQALRGAALEFLLQPAPSLRRQDHQSFSRVLDGESLKANLSGGWSVQVDGAWLLLTHQSFNGASHKLTRSSASSRAAAGLHIHVRVLRCRAAVQEALALAKRDPSRAVLARKPTQLLPFAAGLRYTPIGAQGRKLVSDALREHAIPRILRNTWPLLADDMGVLWAPGLPPAERARVLDSTALAFALTCTGPLKKIIPGAVRRG